jgi:hypothetical protein
MVVTETRSPPSCVASAPYSEVVATTLRAASARPVTAIRTRADVRSLSFMECVL